MENEKKKRLHPNMNPSEDGFCMVTPTHLDPLQFRQKMYVLLARVGDTGSFNVLFSIWNQKI